MKLKFHMNENLFNPKVWIKFLLKTTTLTHNLLNKTKFSINIV